MIAPDWIAPERTALIVIDMQVDFGAPEGEMARRGADMAAPQAALVQAEALVDAARSARVRVVFVRLFTHPGGENRIIREAKERQNDRDPDLCVEGTRGADFIGPKPQAGDAIVSKTRFSAFARTGLGDQLHSWGIDTVVLAGLTTECCIQSSAWNAFEQDFHVLIATDACAAYEEELHRHTLRALELSGATLASSAELTAVWSKYI
ncbi:MAG TPA: isochorismatase family cysteine hydrolase [Rhizomicrobium sp.]|nr:isochorismatase family cysteine hydrolase [Rhizomicrobium sp.]